MKKSIQLFALITLIFSSLTINAQSKVAHIDVQKLITEMPEVITAQKEKNNIHYEIKKTKQKKRNTKKTDTKKKKKKKKEKKKKTKKMKKKIKKKKRNKKINKKMKQKK